MLPDTNYLATKYSSKEENVNFILNLIPYYTTFISNVIYLCHFSSGKLSKKYVYCKDVVFVHTYATCTKNDIVVLRIDVALFHSNAFLHYRF